MEEEEEFVGCISCMSTNDLCDLFGAYAANVENYATMLENCFNIKVTKELKYLCSNCVEKLERCVAFKDQTSKNIAMLQSIKDEEEYLDESILEEEEIVTDEPKLQKVVIIRKPGADPVNEEEDYLDEEHAIQALDETTCIYCDLQLSSVQEVSAHIRVVHGLEPRSGRSLHECPLCGVALADVPDHLNSIKSGADRGKRGAPGAVVGTGMSRPSLSEPLFRTMIEDLPRGSGLERPLHPKRRRSLRPATVKKAGADRGERGAPGAVVGTGMSRPSLSEPLFRAMIEDLPRGSGLERPLKSKKRRSLPPATVEGGGTSTPRATGVSMDAKSSLNYSRTPPGHEISCHLFYGSEEESEEEDDQDEITMPVLMPRSVRAFLQGDDETGNASAELSFAWPPSSTSGSAAPATISPSAEQLAGPAPAPTNPPPAEQLLSHPIDKFDFQWRAFTQPQIEPELRREAFSPIDCGSTAPYATPYDAFIAIWDRQIMENIVVETNRYAQQLAEIMIQLGTLHPKSRITNWHDTTVDELYVFFAIIQATGIVVKTRIEEYWSSALDIFCTPEFSAAMRLDRFLLLSRCLHFRNNDSCNPESMTRSQAKLFKVQPILDHLNYKFSHLYNLEQNIALDESLTQWKSWLDINEFIKNRVAAAIGIKTYEVCESKTGYLWRFEVHAGHGESSNPQDDSPVSGAIPALVLILLKGLEHKGHTIWMDNFYNSPALARELKCRGFDCVGTLQTNREFVPVELTTLTKKDIKIGQVCGCTSGDVDLLVWRDMNHVALISTYHGLATRNCGGTLKPTLIHDYNICMGGVDRKDQMIAMFPIERKRTSVWYKKLFRRLLNASIFNAYILYKSQQSTNQRSFRKTLVIQLLARHTSSRPTPAPSITHRQTNNTTQVFEHYPQQYFVTENANKGNRYRRICAECGKRVTTYCAGCDKALCTFTCFEPYHTKLYKKTAK